MKLKPITGVNDVTILHSFASGNKNKRFTPLNQEKIKSRLLCPYFRIQTGDYKQSELKHPLMYNP